jgi:hypothetical protein
VGGLHAVTSQGICPYWALDNLFNLYNLPNLFEIVRFEEIGEI